MWFLLQIGNYEMTKDGLCPILFQMVTSTSMPHLHGILHGRRVQIDVRENERVTVLSTTLIGTFFDS